MECNKNINKNTKKMLKNPTKKTFLSGSFVSDSRSKANIEKNMRQTRSRRGANPILFGALNRDFVQQYIEGTKLTAESSATQKRGGNKFSFSFTQSSCHASTQANIWC
jgi:hypothetical protein